ncbi:hypothetical protein ES703_57482 [subsurface metagenome]
MEATAKYKPNVEIVADPETLAHRSTAILVADAEKAIKAKNIFYVAISGGHTPKRFFELLSEAPEAKACPGIEYIYSGLTNGMFRRIRNGAITSWPLILSCLKLPSLKKTYIEYQPSMAILRLRLVAMKKLFARFSA